MKPVESDGSDGRSDGRSDGSDGSGGSDGSDGRSDGSDGSGGSNRKSDAWLTRLLADVLSAQGDDLSAASLGQTHQTSQATDTSSQLGAESLESLGTHRATLGSDSDDTRLIEIESQINASRVSAAAGFERALSKSRRLRWLRWKWLSRRH